MLRFSANLSMLFTESPLIERFARARQAGFERVEVQFPYEVPAETLRDAIHDAGVELVLFNVGAGDLLAGGDGLACVPSRRAAFADALNLAAEYASVLRPHFVNVLAGRVPAGETRDACLAQFRESLSATCHTMGAARIGAGASVGVVVEALNAVDMPRFLLASHDDVVSEIVGTSARVQYDVYHQAMMGRDVIADLIADLTSGAPRIGHVQFADVPGRSAPGTGTLDFDAIFSAIARSGYRGSVGAEYRPMGPTAESLGWLRAYRS